jgi:hypothetical protein
MSVEPLEEVIEHWETGQITVEQAIGKILVWLHRLETQLLKLEATPRRPDGSP